MLNESTNKAVHTTVVLIAMPVAIAIKQADLLFSGFDELRGFDELLHIFLHEHYYRWAVNAITGEYALHSSFWDAPVYFPTKNTTAYTHVLLGVAPPYMIARALGAHWDTAFQWWKISMTALNFVAGYILLYRGIRVVRIAALLGAIFIAVIPMSLQLEAKFYIIAFFGMLIWTARAYEEGSSRQTKLALAGATTALILQLWSGFYTSYFLHLLVIVAFAIALSSQPRRKLMIEVVKKHPLTLAGLGTVLVAAAAPLAIHYHKASTEVTGVPISDVLHGSYWLSDWFVGAEPFGIGPMGVIGIAVLLIGIWFGRNRPLVLITIVSLMTLLLIASILSPIPLSLKEQMHEAVSLLAHRPAAGLLKLATMPVIVILGLAVTIAIVWSFKKGGPQARVVTLCLGTVLVLFILGEVTAIYSPLPKSGVQPEPEARLFLWSVIYNYWPAGEAITHLKRVGLFLLMITGLALAFVVDQAFRQKRFKGLQAWLIKAAAVSAAVLCVATYVHVPNIAEGASGRKSGTKTDWRNRVTKIRERAELNGQPFFLILPATHNAKYSPGEMVRAQMLAVFLGLSENTPTVNGYLGKAPVGFLSANREMGRVGLMDLLMGWQEIHDIEVQVIDLSAVEDPEFVSLFGSRTKPGAAQATQADGLRTGAGGGIIR